MAELAAEFLETLDGPKSEMQQVLDMLEAHEEDPRPATMKSCSVFTKRNLRSSSGRDAHKQQMEKEVVDAAENAGKSKTGKSRMTNLYTGIDAARVGSDH